MAADFDDAGKAGPVFGAELGLFLLQIAAARMKLIEERGGKVGIWRLQARIGGDYHLRIALRGGAILGFAEDAIGSGGDQLAAQLVDLKESRGVLGFTGLAVGPHLRCAQNAVLRLVVSQTLVVPVNASLEIGELGIEPAGALRCGLNLRFDFLLLIVANERIDDRSR